MAATASVRAHIEDGSILQKVIDAARYALHEVNFSVDGEGFFGEGIDDSRSLVVQIKLRKQGFEDFDCVSELNLGLSLQNLHDVFRCSFVGDSMTFSAEKGGENLFVDFESKQEDRESTFSIKLMDQSNFDNMGDVDFDLQPEFSVTMNSAVLNRFVTEFANMSKSAEIKIKVDETSLELIPRKLDLIEEGSTINHRICESPGKALEISQDGDAESYSAIFSVASLQKMCKAHSISEQATLYFSEGRPLCIHFNLGDLGYIRYHLVPTVEAEDIGTQMSQMISQSQ